MKKFPIYVAHYPDVTPDTVKVCASLEEAKTVIKEEERYGDSRHFRFIEAVFDEERLVKLIERQLSYDLDAWLFHEEAFAYNYVVLFNESVVEYIERQRPGWEALKRKYATLYTGETDTRELWAEAFCIEAGEWDLSLFRNGERIHFGGFIGWNEEFEVPADGFVYEFTTDVISAYLQAQANARTRENKAFAEDICGALSVLVTAYLRKLQGWPEMKADDYVLEDEDCPEEIFDYDLSID